MIASFSGEYAFLSNFFPSLIVGTKGVYSSVEHAYQAAKATNEEDRKRIAMAATPGEAKRLGRRVKMRPDWEDIKVGVMQCALRMKFHEAHLRQLLLATGDEELVEGNTWGDRFWGQCPVGVGENMLGRLLMQLRSELRAGVETGK